MCGGAAIPLAKVPSWVSSGDRGWVGHSILQGWYQLAWAGNERCGPQLPFCGLPQGPWLSRLLSNIHMKP